LGKPALVSTEESGSLCPSAVTRKTMTNEIIDDVLSDLAERYKHDPYLKLSVAQVVDILLDVRSRLELVQG
jgi:hypothetical protein